jgi:IS1 family transposase
MKLIACLIALSLIIAFWSTGLASPRAGTVPAGHTVPEQLQSDHAPFPLPLWWGWDVWVERVCASHRGRRRRPRRWRKHQAGRLERWLYRWRRWRRRWGRLWRQWQALTDGAVPVQPVATPEPAVTVEADDAGHQPCDTPAPTAESPAETGSTTKPGPGRPRTIPTAHRCCPHEGCRAYGRSGDDPLHDIVGYGTYTTVHGEVRQMYRCNVCGQPFSETAGTPFADLKTPIQTVCTALQELAEGLGIRAVARIHGLQPDTVLEWLKKAGLHCQLLSEYMMQELQVTQVQLDELWTFVRKKERMLKAWEKLHSTWGDTWVWVAFDPVHKLVIAVLVGERTEEEAVGFLGRLRARLAATCQPLLTSDSLPHYIEAILRVFGVWGQPPRNGDRGRFPKPRQMPAEGLKYATVHKERQKGRVVSVTTRIVYGRKEEIQALLDAVKQKINTSFVERINLTLRHLASRLHRKTLCFSKEREYLVYHLHLVLTYYHFTRYHASLRVALPEPLPTRGSGSPKKWQPRTPAMSAGLTDRPLSLRELLMYQVPVGP